MLEQSWKQLKSSSLSRPATVSFTLSTSLFYIETTYVNLKSKIFLHIFLCQGEKTSILKGKAKDAAV